MFQGESLVGECVLFEMKRVRELTIEVGNQPLFLQKSIPCHIDPIAYNSRQAMMNHYQRWREFQLKAHKLSLKHAHDGNVANQRLVLTFVVSESGSRRVVSKFEGENTLMTIDLYCPYY